MDSSWLSLDEMTKVEEVAEGVVTQETLKAHEEKSSGSTEKGIERD